MDRTSQFLGVLDLFVVFVYGTGLSYFHFYVYPLTATNLWIASGVLALFLGSFGPQLEEILEWIIAFGVGVCFALTIPLITQYIQTGDYNLRMTLECFLEGVPFTLQLLTPWVGCLPVGWVFYKITHRNYYRHARFF